MKSIPVTFLIVFCVAIWEFGSTNPVAMSCDSCGSECARACGTRHFRSCCFNYVRKRSSVFHPYSLNTQRYENLYRLFPYGKNEIKSQNKIELEQKPRKNYLPASEGSSQSDLARDRSVKSFFNSRKEDLEAEESANADDYDEKGRESQQQQHLAFET